MDSHRKRSTLHRLSVVCPMNDSHERPVPPLHQIYLRVSGTPWRCTPLPDRAAEVFRRVNPRLAVYSHILLIGDVTADDVVGRTRLTYSGPLEMGEDLTVLDVGRDVKVRRRLPDAVSIENTIQLASSDVGYEPVLQCCPFLALSLQQTAANGSKARHKAKVEHRPIL